MDNENSSVFPALKDAEFMVLTTFRRDGASVPTTVWFAQVGEKLYVTTLDHTGKAKRIRNTPSVTVAPSTARGDMLGGSQNAKAEVLDPAENAAAEAALIAKYPQAADIFAGKGSTPARTGTRVFIAVMAK